MNLIPQLPIYAAVGGCLLTCGVFAAVLSTKRGQEATLNYTWVMVVAGVCIVLAWMATVNTDAAWLALLFFIAGGTPMILRSLWLMHKHQQETMDYLRNNRGE